MTEATLSAWRANEEPRPGEPRSLAQRLLDETKNGPQTLSQRLRFGLLFASSLGAAVDLGAGPARVFGENALAVPLILLAGVPLCLPGLSILLKLCDSTLSLESLLGAAGRALCCAGLAQARRGAGGRVVCIHESELGAHRRDGRVRIDAGTVALTSFVRALLRQHKRIRPSFRRGLFCCYLGSRLPQSF